jgi:adenylate cyclase
MESLSEPGMIQVTAHIQRSLADRYSFQTRGQILVKGKGPMETFYLLGPRSNVDTGLTETAGTTG